MFLSINILSVVLDLPPLFKGLRICGAHRRIIPYDPAGVEGATLLIKA